MLESALGAKVLGLVDQQMKHEGENQAAAKEAAGGANDQKGKDDEEKLEKGGVKEIFGALVASTEMQLVGGKGFSLGKERLNLARNCFLGIKKQRINKVVQIRQEGAEDSPGPEHEIPGAIEPALIEGDDGEEEDCGAEVKNELFFNKFHDE